MNSNRAFTFNDIVLVPDYSEIEHGDVDIKTDWFGITVRLPVLSSPMDTISGIKMLRAFSDFGCRGIHHRYCGMEDLRNAIWFGDIAVSPSMGIDTILSVLPSEVILVMDVAHGHTKRNIEFAKELVDAGYNVVSGNIVTPHAMYHYAKIGVKHFRVGIGSGSVCTTRMVTGVGYPQASAIQELYNEIKDNQVDYKLISDGGHKTTGDIIKALVLGADFVMLGGMLAGTDESAGKYTYKGTDETRTYFSYRGMASEKALSTRKQDFFVEGISKDVEAKGSVKHVLKNIENAIETACYYLGVRNLKELKEVSYQLVTESSYAEGLPYWK